MYFNACLCYVSIFSHEEDGEYFVEEDPEFNEIYEEFEKFMQEQEALSQWKPEMEFFIFRIVMFQALQHRMQ